VRSQNEAHAAGTHCLEQRQHVAARHAEAALDARALEERYDQIRIVHAASNSTARAGTPGFSATVC
jgi:hypothetical protein